MAATPRQGEREEPLETGYRETRKTLIERLGNWEDQKSWDEFYQTYWRLIYSVALKAGLRQEEAWDVVQETVLGLAKQARRDIYDPSQGSFKAWLLNMTRWRVADQFRKRQRDPAHPLDAAGHFDDDNDSPHPIERIEDPLGGGFDQMWDGEWARNLADLAVRRAQARVSPLQFQIYECYVLRDWDVSKVCQTLGISAAQAYLAKHRVGNLVKKELKALGYEGDSPR